MANRSTLDRSEATTRRTYKSNSTNRKNYCRTKRVKESITGGAVMNKQKYIYYDPQNPEFCKKMVAKYGEDWNIDDFFNDTSDDFTTPTFSSIRVPKLKEVQQ